MAIDFVSPPAPPEQAGGDLAPGGTAALGNETGGPSGGSLNIASKSSCLGPGMGYLPMANSTKERPMLQTSERTVYLLP